MAAVDMARFRRLADLTVVSVFALIVLGGIVRVSDSGLGCGPGGSGTEGWPLCNGEAVPFFHDTQVIIEFSHRVLAAVVTALIAALAWIAYRRLRELRWARRATIAAGVLVLVQAALGGLTVEKGLDEELVAAHLGLAMVLLAVLLWISVRARAEPAAEDVKRTDQGRERTLPGLRPFAAVAIALLLCAIVAGGYVAGTEKEGVVEGRNVAGAHLACGKQFPTCLDDRVLPFGESRLSDIHLTHRVLVYAASLAIVVLLAAAWRRAARTRLLAVAAALLLAQLMLGALNVWLGEHAILIVAHLITATLLWSTVLLIAYRLAWAPEAVATRLAPRGEPSAATA